MRAVVCLLFSLSFLGFTGSAAAARVKLGSGYFCGQTKGNPALYWGKSSRSVKKVAFKTVLRDLKKKKKTAKGRAKTTISQTITKVQQCKNPPSSPPPNSPPVLGPSPTPTPIDYCRGKEFLWNVSWDVSVRDQPPFDLTAAPRMQSDRVRLVMGPWFGAFPMIRSAVRSETDRTSWLGIPAEVRNGINYTNSGTPLYANIQAHTDAIRRHITSTIPDPNFDGYFVFDQEEWFTPWDFTPSNYQEEALRQFRLANPGMSESASLAATRQLWASRVVELYLASVQTVRELRPHAKIGFYDLMLRVYWDGYAGNRGDYLRAQNDLSLPVFEASDFIVADIYQFYRSAVNNQGIPIAMPTPYASPPNGNAYFEMNRRYVEENVLEARRLAHLAGGKPVMAYAWMRYHDSAAPGDRFYLNNAGDLFVQMIYPLMIGADMVAMWGNEIPVYSSLPQGGLQPYINSVMGPMIEGYCQGDLGSLAPIADLVQ